MAERICLLTFYPTKCKDNCFNCDCGGAGATKDMYVTINNVQRVCSITGGAADTDEGEYIAEVIRNNLEKMVIEAQPVKRGEWEKKSSVGVFRCSLCQHIFMLGADEIDEYHFCPHCGADMRGEQK